MRSKKLAVRLAAWGWSATKQRNTLARVIERELNRRLPCGDTREVEVINLAMNGSNSFQNAIALNLWGHPLEPDLVATFSGGNDMLLWGPPMYEGFHIVYGLVTMARRSSNPA